MQNLSKTWAWLSSSSPACAFGGLGTRLLWSLHWLGCIYIGWDVFTSMILGPADYVTSCNSVALCGVIVMQYQLLFY